MPILTGTVELDGTTAVGSSNVFVAFAPSGCDRTSSVPDEVLGSAAPASTTPPTPVAWANPARLRVGFGDGGNRLLSAGSAVKAEFSYQLRKSKLI